MTQIERDGQRILLALLSELEVFCTIDDALFQTGHPYVWSMQHVGIPYRPVVWFGGPLSGGRRKALTRATQKLTQDGLVTRTTEKKRDRVTHLRLTRQGFKRAWELADSKPDPREMTESLARIGWADEVWDELDQLTNSN